MLIQAKLDGDIVPGVIEFDSVHGMTSFTLGVSRSSDPVSKVLNIIIIFDVCLYFIYILIIYSLILHILST